ncbi:hypothetical protein DPX16_8130 [Anabarilius grahami]|uniref:Uncharacterized protein n=1 Tax=Anabarilius grahami TaxID=495550 RepID=A0A3N0Y9G8_ANAGA|nr:hypothetical protein DPX16_8130 [Anabarilius grahami]
MADFKTVLQEASERYESACRIMIRIACQTAEITHAGLKWNAVPTMVKDPDPPLPLDLRLRRKRSKMHQKLPVKKRQKKIVCLANVISATAESVQQPPDSVVHPPTAVTSPDAPVAGPSTPLTPLLPTAVEPSEKERALKLKIRNLSAQVCKLKAKMRKMTPLKKTVNAAVNKAFVMEQLKKLLPAKAYAFVSTQIRASQRKARGFRWSTQDKAFFLSLLHASPKCYSLLLKVFFMPSVRTLQKLVKSGAVPPVTANAEAEQVEEPMDCILNDQFDSRQISSFSSDDHVMLESEVNIPEGVLSKRVLDLLRCIAVSVIL